MTFLLAQEDLGTRSEYGDESAFPQTPFTPHSTLGDTSPDAL